MEEKIIPILREAGKILLSADGIERSVHEKTGSSNFVTTYDVAVQDLLISRLGALYPDAGFFAEEKDDNVLTDAPTFIIDPIDGTTNFIRGLSRSAISVAYFEKRLPARAFVYDPYTDEIFTAEKGKGAYLDKGGRRVRLVRRDCPLSASLSVVGTNPYAKAETMEETMKGVRLLLSRSLDLRRSGSAVLDLAHIAAGRYDLFFEMRTFPWDCAAGRLLVTEAGGCVLCPDGTPLPYDRPAPILAGAPSACREFIAAFSC